MAMASSTCTEEEEESKFNDIKLMKIEAESAVREISFAVGFVEISRTLPTTDDSAYMNIRTKEGAEFCIELTVQGYRVSQLVLVGPFCSIWQ